MPDNIKQITTVNQLPLGTLMFYQIDSETDAAYYANGRDAYLYKSHTNALYLYVPVVQ